MVLRRSEPISFWEAGDTIQGFGLLTKKEVRQDRNGRDYLDMAVADATGNIAAKVWSDSPALSTEYEAHDFIAFRGFVKSYRDQLQLTVEECRRANDSDRRLGFDESLLIPSAPEDIDDLWQRLLAVVPGQIQDSEMRRLAESTIEVYGDRLREHPAAKTMHHAYRGGLLHHTASMAELAAAVCAHYPDVDRDLVLVGVLFHDLGKLLELGAMPANDYTLVGRLVGHVILGRDLLLERCAALGDFPEDRRLLLEHLILSHQGRKEYGSPVEPMTLEALVLHFIDDLDSKVNQLQSARADGPEVQYSRGLGRFIYVPPLEKS